MKAGSRLQSVTRFFHGRSEAAPANANIGVSHTHVFVELNYHHTIGVSGYERHHDVARMSSAHLPRTALFTPKHTRTLEDKQTRGGTARCRGWPTSARDARGVPHVLRVIRSRPRQVSPITVSVAVAVVAEGGRGSSAKIEIVTARETMQ
jgi:hypothetical protein